MQCDNNNYVLFVTFVIENEQTLFWKIFILILNEFSVFFYASAMGYGFPFLINGYFFASGATYGVGQCDFLWFVSHSHEAICQQAYQLPTVAASVAC